ncbi:MAG TPA: hypothetical protein VLF69_06255 [Candidatus Saccharimonadales bacterium]|nr:hypothetical protein [Candidatus Saccharimonadales bacterium]
MKTFHKIGHRIQQSVATLMGVLAIVFTLVLTPLTSGTAFAANCSSNNINDTQWGTPFQYTSPSGATYTLYPSPLLFTGSTCGGAIKVWDVNANCGFGAGFYYQKWNPAGHNYFGIQSATFPNPVFANYGDSVPKTVESGVPNNSGYRLDMYFSPPAGCTAKPNVPILD